jgi:DNA-binding NarL/FixJ family response regulator
MCMDIKPWLREHDAAGAEDSHRGPAQRDYQRPRIRRHSNPGSAGCRSDNLTDLLSDREREILQVIAEGRSNKEVANLLNISLTTVETHRAHILQKLDIHSVPELALYALHETERVY